MTKSFFVIDVNVFISAFLFTNSKPREALDKAQDFGLLSFINSTQPTKNSFYLIKKETIMPNPIQRPNFPQKPAQSTTSPERKVITTGGNSGDNNNNRGGGGGNNNNRGGNNNPPLPSPWLDANNLPNPDPTASFVEYIRWMREADHPYKDATKTQILQLATEKAKNGYNERLKLLNERLKLITDNTFQVKSSWRIRVGGHRGVENILLPAFDHLGMPFIPSASLKGVARNQAIRELMTKENIDYKTAEKHPQITKYFGNLDGENSTNNAGQIIFFDAYPLPNQHGLTMDMANNIWSWEGNELKYSPNPNVFLSLKEPTFLIGLKLASNQTDVELLEQVKQWLIKGLQTGVGSQINTGYGEFLVAGKGRSINEFFRVEFALEGQLIHGNQKFDDAKQPYQKDKTGKFKTDPSGKLKPDGKVQAEVRPIAFKSMLRYWFRAFALGVLPANIVQEWEGKLFGLIQPDRYEGWVKFRILESNYNSQTKEYPGEQTGILSLSYHQNTPKNYQTTIKDLFDNLVWLMFHLGGVGQGARRSCYKRNSNPFYRGSTLYIDHPKDFAKLPSTLTTLCQLFQQKIRGFYAALASLTNQQNLGNSSYRELVRVYPHQWAEVIDRNCKIIVVSGNSNSNKPYALDILHQQFHQLESERKFSEMKSLCGGVKKDTIKIDGQDKKRDVTASPIWIRDLDRYQVVTVFGATENPRKRYLEELRSKTSAQNYATVFPLPKERS